MVQQHLSAGDFTVILPDHHQNVATPVTPTRTRWVRDSVTRLNKIGRPGSRRYQRYLNREFLQEQQWDLQPEDFQVVCFSKTTFSLLFEEENRQLWAPFVDVTEEEERVMLQRMCSGRPVEENDELGDWVVIDSINAESEVKKNPIVKPHICFMRVDKRVRKYIQKNPDSPMLESMDKGITQYIQEEKRKKTYNFENSFHRLICHGVCQFYSLHSCSEDNEDGSRALHISKPRSHNSPSVTLSEFLQTLPVNRM